MATLALRTAAGFGIALTAALVLMPLALALGRRYQFVVRPRGGRRRRKRVSYLGGMALALAAAIAAFSVTGFGRDTPLFLGAAVVLLAGVADDRWGLSAPLQAVLQLGVAVGVWAVEFRGVLPRGPLQGVVAVVVLLAGMNACRLLDTMDGVAGSGALGTATALVGLGLVTGHDGLAVLSASLGGACLGFLRYNFGRARLNLGSGGALFLGLMLAGGALRGSASFGPPWYALADVAILAVFLGDAVVITLSRVARAQRVSQERRDHVSHRLVGLGMSTGAAAVTLGLVALVSGGAVVVAVHQGNGVIIGALGVIASGLVLLGARRPPAEARQESGRPGEPATEVHEERVPHGRLRAEARQERPRRPWLRLGLLCGAVVAVAVLAAVPSVLVAAERLNQAKIAFNSAAASAGSLDLTGAEAHFAQAGTLAQRARTSLDSPLTAVARFVPVVGGNIEAARRLAGGAVQMAEAGSKATAAGKLLAPARSPGAATPAGLDQIKMGPWQQASTLLAQAATLASSALDAVRPSPGLLVPPLGAARLEFLRKGEKGQAALSRARDGAALVPVLFGARTPRTFFLAIENPDEMRATGGLIGAFGILQAQGGKLTLTGFNSDAALPKVPAPVPASPRFIARYDRFNSRSMWSNVNMSPDFPTTAKLISEMWQSATGTRINGVISVDAQGLRDLLGAVGPVTASDGTVISPANFLSVALNQAYLKFPTKTGRVNYLLEVGHQVWSRLASGQFTSVRGLAGSLDKAVEGKDLQVWIPGHQGLLARLGVTGALTPPKPGEDYLYVVGQNAAANKIDYYAQRSIDYTVVIGANGSVSGQLGVQVQNNTPSSVTAPYIVGPFLPSDPPGLNRSYVSVYLPQATHVLKATVGGAPVGIESETEAGLGVVSRFLEALPGHRSTWMLQTVGLKTTLGEYRLILQHQPTLNPDQFRLEVVVPQGDSVEKPVPSGATSGGRVLIWQGTLGSDMQFVVHYGAGSH